MKKIYSAIVAVIFALMLVPSCDIISPADFGDINKDPNTPSTAYTNYLFTYACNYIPWTVLGDATNGYDPWQQLWNGYFSESKNNQYGQLGTTTQYTRIGSIYLYALKNLDMIIKMNEDPEQVNQPNVGAFGTPGNQIAASKTLSGFFYMFLTDMIGPIVMSEAFQGASQDNWKPKYDTQKQVYTQLDEMLSTAFTQFDESGTLTSAYDVVYSGDIAKWKKLNASIRMLLAIKLCDVDPATGKTRFAKAYADGGMKSAEDGFDFTYDDLHWNMLYYWDSPDYAGAGKNIVPNYIIVEKMKELKDNRMFKYFDIEGYKGERKESIFPRDQYTSFYGVPFGLSTNTDVTDFADCCSSISYDMLAMSGTIPVIPAARVLLTEAEAALRGWISADAKELYEAGIQASFDWWKADGADKYITSPGVAYDASNAMEQIALQRWIASYLSDGVEAWSDWRRLDYPHLPVGPAAIDKGIDQYAYRMKFYTDTDVAYNEENYKAVLSDLSDGDKTTSRVWWDVKDNTKYALTPEQCVPSVVIPPEWKEVVSGTYYVLGAGSAKASPVGAEVFGHNEFSCTLYQDLNHPDIYKLSPFGETELLLNWDAATETFFVPNQIVGTNGGQPVNMADRDTDQGTDNKYRGEWDPEDGCLYIYVIYRNGGPAGTGTISNYGYDVFEPAA